MKTLLFFIFAILAIQVTSNVVQNPRDLVDEVEDQLEQLASLVHGEILVAHDNLNALESDFLTHSNNVQSQAIIDLEQEQETIDQQLQNIKNLAQSANKDISSCTDIREELLERLPEEYQDSLKSCISDKNVEETTIIINAKYITDVSINEVHRLEFQFAICRGNLECLSPLLTEVLLYQIRIPQNIKTELNSAETLMSTLKLSVDQCSEQTVSEYTGQAVAILSDITDCVDNILS